MKKYLVTTLLLALILLQACSNDTPETMKINDKEYSYNERLIDSLDLTKGTNDYIQLQIKGLPPERTPDYKIELNADDKREVIIVWEENKQNLSYLVDIKKEKNHLFTQIKGNEAEDIKKLIEEYEE
jgi:outer membrane biogenesis lipoprotein LolB